MDLTLIVRLWAPKTKEDSAKSCPRAELKAFFPPLTELLDSKTYNPKIPWIKVMEAMCGQNLSFFSQEGLKSAYGKKDFFLLVFSNKPCTLPDVGTKWPTQGGVVCGPASPLSLPSPSGPLHSLG